MLNIQTNVSLLPYNTFHLDVNAKYFVEIHTEDELPELFASEIFKKEKKRVLGGGANVLLTGDVDGLLIKMSIKGKQELQTSESLFRELRSFLHLESLPFGKARFISAAAGEDWSEFVEYCNAHGRAGIENLIAIPGQVGTAPISNIGAYGMEAANRIARVEGYHMETGSYASYPCNLCNFAYRNSIFKSELRNTFLITKVVFLLEKFDEHYPFITNYADVQTVLKGETPTTLSEISECIKAIRAKKLPDTNVIGTAGSFFANPFVGMQHFEALQKEYPEMPFWEVDASLQPKQVMKLSAGRLIEKAGLKGYSNGKAGTSPNHALVIINEGGSAHDVLEVVEHVQTTVKEKFGIALQPEVVYIG